jgi:hypothetical protein
LVPGETARDGICPERLTSRRVGTRSPWDRRPHSRSPACVDGRQGRRSRPPEEARVGSRRLGGNRICPCRDGIIPTYEHCSDASPPQHHHDGLFGLGRPRPDGGAAQRGRYGADARGRRDGHRRGRRADGSGGTRNRHRRTWGGAWPPCRGGLCPRRSPDGRLASGADDGQVLLWDPAQVASAAGESELQAQAVRSTAANGRRARRKTDVARVVAVHGLGQQYFGSEELRARWLPALQDGLERVGAEPLAQEELAVAFYGDLFRPRGSASAEQDADEIDQGVEEELLVAMWRTAATEEGTPGPESASETRGPGLRQRALRALNSSRFFSGLSERALIGDLREVRSYLQDAAIRRAAQNRVAAKVGSDTRVVLAHSTGSIVAYETLCAHPEWDVHMFVTLGSPLGWRLVFDNLKPPPQDGVGSWPGSTRRWTNIADTDDLVALEKRLATKFAGPVRDILVDNGARAHDLVRYLTSAETGRAIAAGLSI